MLQIIISFSERYSIGEMAQMAVEAGASWLVLSLPGNDAGQTREMCADVVELCRESGVMLSIENCVESARELAMHGVFLTDKNISPVKVREELGAEANNRPLWRRLPTQLLRLNAPTSIMWLLRNRILLLLWQCAMPEDRYL